MSSVLHAMQSLQPVSLGHWLAASVDADMHTVRVKEGSKKYNFIGWYKGVIVSSDQHDPVKKTAAAPCDFFRYSYGFDVMVRFGAVRVNCGGQQPCTFVSKPLTLHNQQAQRCF